VGLGREQPGWGHVVDRIDGMQMTGKCPHHQKAVAPPVRAGVDGQAGPGKGVLGGDCVGPVGLRIADEVGKEQAGAAQLEAEGPSDGEVVVELGAQGEAAHDAAPGQGNAKVRSRSRSTLA
jgi:hypothetical protein